MDQIIALSGKQFAGKDQLADYLLTLLPEFQKIPLAKAIKNEFAAIYHMTPEEIEADKSLYREGLITLGQRRRAQNPDYWLNKVLWVSGPKIISDVRLQHEFDVLKSHNAFLIRINADRKTRAERGTLVNEYDATECELDDTNQWDWVVVNDGSLVALKEQANAIAKTVQAQFLSRG